MPSGACRAASFLKEPKGSLKGMYEGAAAPSCVIHSGGMYAAKSGRSLLPLSFGVSPKGAREMTFSFPCPQQVCDSRLAAKACRTAFFVLQYPRLLQRGDERMASTVLLLGDITG